MKGINTTRPNVYKKLKQVLPTFSISDSFTRDHKQALLNAKNHLKEPLIDFKKSFNNRLIDDGGNKIIVFLLVVLTLLAISKEFHSFGIH